MDNKTIIQFNSNYIFRLEYWGSLLISRETKEMYEMDKENTLYLLLIYYYGVEIANKYSSLDLHQKKEMISNINSLSIFNLNKCTETISKTPLNLKKDIEKFWNNNKKNLSFPLQVAIYPTLKCNLRCKFCFMNKKLLSEDTHANKNLKNILDLIDKCDKNGVLTFSILGGEPTLYSDFMTILKELEKRKIHTSFTTNGSHISDELIYFLKKSNYIIPIISIQALNEKNFELMGIEYKDILNTVNKLYYSNIKFNINIVYTRQTVNELFEIIDYFENKKVGKISLAVYVETNTELKENIKSFSELRIIKEKIEKYIKENNKKVFFTFEGCMFYFAYPEYKNKKFNLTNFEKLEYGCEVGQTKLEIMSNGNISICPAHTMTTNDYINVFNEDILDVWNNNKELNYYRNLVNTDPKCKDCSLNFFCNGGCPAERIKKQKKFEIEGERDPRCIF